MPLLAAGTLTLPLVDRDVPMDDAVTALDAVRQPGKLGKLLLELG